MTIRSRFALLFLLVIGACRTDSVEHVDSNAPNALPSAVLWSDLLRPVDHETRAPVADAAVVVIAGDGALTEHTLADVVSPGQLEDGVLAALDGPQHLPRFFRPSELREHTGSPREVALAAAGTIEIHGADELAEPLLPITVMFVLVRDTADLDEQARIHTAEGDAERPPQPELDSGAWRALLDPATSAADRARIVREAFIDGRGAEALPLERSPHVFFERMLQRKIVHAFPFVFEDAAVGFEYLVAFEADRRYRVTPSEFAARGRRQGARVEVSRDEPVVLVVHALGRSSLRVRAPAGASELRGTLVNGETMLTSAGEPTDELVFDDVEPIASRLLAQWTNADGSHAAVVERFGLIDGETMDLGELASPAELTLTVVPRVFVGGHEDALLLGALAAGCVWTPRIELGVGSSGGVFERAFDRVEPFVLHATDARRATLTVDSVELPDSLKSSYRWRASPPHRLRDLEGASDVRIDLHFESVRAIVVRLTVPPSPDGTARRVEGHVVHATSGTAIETTFDATRDRDPTAEWTLVGTTHVPRTTGWIQEVVVSPRIAARDYRDESRAFPPAWFARAELAADTTELAPTLERAATVVLREATSVLITPVYRAADDQGEASLVRAQRLGERVVYFGLRPGVRYRREGYDSDSDFVAPAAGETLHGER
jgi:hypothetical protein